LYDYLASLLVDYEPLIWSFKPLNKSEIDAAGGRPYVRVTELAERPTVAMYGNQDVVEATVDVQIFQAPLSDGRTPSRSRAMELYFDLYDAPDYVNEWTYGQTLISIHRDVAFPPNYDEDSGGLAGMIRFRLLFPRG
jgi:hypothetical protein